MNARSSIDEAPVLPADPSDRGPVQEAEWRSLYVAHGERVFRLLHRLTGDPDLAADLTQETFVRAHDRRGEFKGLGAVGAWLGRIATNLARDHYRTHRRRLDVLRLEGQAQPVASSPARGVEARVLLEQSLASLPADQRAALLLFEVDGFSHKEIAEMFGVAEGTSRAWVTRAKRTLRQIIGD